MSFQKNKYCVIKEAVPKQIATFVYNYFMMKRQVARTLFDLSLQLNLVYGMMNKFQILIPIMQI
jgi:hypothetical protein